MQHSEARRARCTGRSFERWASSLSRSLDRRRWTADGSQSGLFLAHLDLSPENVLVDAESGALLGIVDWEFAGFIPDWLALAHRRGSQMSGCRRGQQSTGGRWMAKRASETRLDCMTSRTEWKWRYFGVLWAREVAWEDQPLNISASKDKRQAWRACERMAPTRTNMCMGTNNGGPRRQRIRFSRLRCRTASRRASEADQTSHCSPSTVESSIGPTDSCGWEVRLWICYCPCERPGLRLNIHGDEDEDSETEELVRRRYRL